MIRTPAQHNTTNPAGQFSYMNVRLVMEATKCSEGDANKVVMLMDENKLSLAEAAKRVGVLK